MSTFELYADGACQPNPGTGGWAFILRNSDNPANEISMSGGEKQSTNNRMELKAAIEGLRYFRDYILTNNEKLILVLDSKYVLNGISQWSDNWIKQGWKKKNGKPVLNADMWQEILSLTNNLDITFQHVRGHSGEKYNEKCDQLATSAAKKLKEQL